MPENRVMPNEDDPKIPQDPELGIGPQPPATGLGPQTPETGASR